MVAKQLILVGNMSKKSFPDYYTMELGHQLDHSGEYGMIYIQL
jgi:hypothetical protein